MEGDVVDTVVEYAPPTPPAGTHRYMFVAFEQVGSTAQQTAPAGCNCYTAEYGLRVGCTHLHPSYVRMKTARWRVCSLQLA
jgi:hypothetical protein